METSTNSLGTELDLSCRKRKKSRGRSRCRKFRGGKKTRNAFLNFLRDYRRKCCGRTVSQIAKHGAKVWKCMPSKEKLKYVQMACKCPKRPRRSKSRGHTLRGRSHRGHSRRRHSRGGKARRRRGSKHRSHSRSKKAKCGAKSRRKTRKTKRRKSKPCPKKTC